MDVEQVRRDWPLVGRDDVVAAALGDLADRECGGVLLVGDTGVGATRVLDEVIAHLRGARRGVNRVVGSPANRNRPLAAVAHVLPDDVLAAPHDDRRSVAFERIRSLIGDVRRPADRYVTAVDEIEHLDDESFGLLTQLIAAGVAVVIGTIGRRDTMPPALSALERSCGLRRIDLRPLDLHDTLDLVDRVLPGPVDGTTAMQLWSASLGHPLFLREAIDGSRASGALTDVHGMWTTTGPLTTSSLATASFDRALDALDQADRAFVDVLALTGPVPIEAVVALDELDRAVRLERAGVVTSRAADRPLVDLAHPLLAAGVRAGLSPLQRRVVLPRALRLLELAGRPDDLVAAAGWALDCDLDIDADQLVGAAATARSRDDLVTTERLASAALERGAGLEALLLAGDALHGLCRFDEAEAVLARAERAVEADGGDDIGRLRLAVTRHRLLLWGEHDADGSAAVLLDARDRIDSPVVRDLIGVALANTYVFSGRVREVGGPAPSPDLAPAGDDPVVAVGHTFPQTIATLLTGRVERAVEQAMSAERRRNALPTDAPIGHPALWGLSRGMALVECGRFGEADHVLAEAYRAAVVTRIPQLHTWLALARGRVALYSGDAIEARRWFVEGRAVAATASFDAGLRVAITGLQIVAGLLRDVETSRRLDAEAETLPDDRGLLWPERRLGHAWSAVTRGDLPTALDLLLEGADEAAARGERLLELACCFEAARLGAARRVSTRVAALAGTVDGALSEARLAFVRGAAGDDLRSLASAERGFAHVGAWLWAAEAAAQCTRVLDHDGRRRDAQGAAARSAQYLRDLPGVWSPALVGAVAPQGLSAREREIAEVAARGVPSKVIARDLGLSVRTVSNHLQNVYLKLGVSGRADLADALGIDGRPG